MLINGHNSLIAIGSEQFLFTLITRSLFVQTLTVITDRIVCKNEADCDSDRK